MAIASMRSIRRAFTFVLAASLTVGVAHAQDNIPEEARLHFSAGVNLLKDPAGARYEEAYREFKAAYGITPSYKILPNMGVCAMKLERDAEAIAAYERYLREAKDVDPEERAQIERDLVTLKVGLAKVNVEARPAATIVDVRVPAHGESITNVYGPIGDRSELAVRRGHHVMKARFPDGRELTWELDVQGGESHLFEAPAAPTNPQEPVVTRQQPTPPPAERPTPTTVYISGAATGMFAAGALVTGLLALDAHSRFEKKNDGSDTTAADSVRSQGQTLNVVSDVLILATLVGAGVTTYFYVTRPSKTAERTGLVVGPTGVFGRF